MTYRQINGLWFKVFSPSIYELCARDDASSISLVTIAYIPEGWFIDVLMKHGKTHYRGPFKTRDEAVALIAGRIAA